MVAGIRREYRVRRLVLAALVLAFAALYPSLVYGGSCSEPGCPNFAHGPAAVELPAGMLAASLVTVSVAPFAGPLKRRPASDRKPAEIHLSPEPDPPRL